MYPFGVNKWNHLKTTDLRVGFPVLLLFCRSPWMSTLLGVNVSDGVKRPRASLASVMDQNQRRRATSHLGGRPRALIRRETEGSLMTPIPSIFPSDVVKREAWNLSSPFFHLLPPLIKSLLASNRRSFFRILRSYPSQQAGKNTRIQRSAR